MVSAVLEKIPILPTLLAAQLVAQLLLSANYSDVVSELGKNGGNYSDCHPGSFG